MTLVELAESMSTARRMWPECTAFTWKMDTQAEDAMYIVLDIDGSGSDEHARAVNPRDVLSSMVAKR